MIAARHGGAGNQPGAPTVGVLADLTISLGSHSAHLTGSGSDLVLTTADPLSFWQSLSTAELPAGLGSINAPKALGRAADLLSAQGLTFRIVGPSGDLVRLGAAGNSRLTRMITGSNSIELGDFRALAPLLRGSLTQSKAVLATAGVAAAVITFLVVNRTRKRS